MDATGFYLVPQSKTTLPLLNSRVLWFVLTQIGIPLRLRGGLWQYRAKMQFVKRLPIPKLTAEQESGLAALAEEITALAQRRYTLHEGFRRMIRDNFGGGEIGTQVDLYRWWEFPHASALSEAVRKHLGQAIPLAQQLKEWQGFLAEQRAAHEQLTGEIVTAETRLNAIVYDAFGLDAAERDLIERTTKYPYGAV